MTVGVVGAGQLGRMLALAGYPLGLDFLFLDRAADSPAGQLAPTLVGELSDPGLLRELAARCNVITFDWENASVSALRAARRGRRVRIAPPLRALAVGQDRVAEKKLFNKLRIPTTRWAAVNSYSALQRAVRQIGLPGVLKTRRFGYDGKGQTVLRTASQLPGAWQQLGAAPLLYEEWIDFDGEVSAIGARARDGTLALYPLSRNFHHQGILRLTLAPWDKPALLRLAQRYLRAVLAELDYVGVLAIEFFVRGRQLLANELAPRVHNSGHWTIEGAQTSQFENHLRAIMDLPLGSTRPRGHAAMINLLGAVPARARLLAAAGVHLHDYGKQPRAGRKVGHCTIVEATAKARDARARRLLRDYYPQLPLIP
ncbi:MAG TPA: 5-(carboxyamino)imidazole ribonucleotide synthase [Steroidobacteraceae bacterium]